MDATPSAPPQRRRFGRRSGLIAVTLITVSAAALLAAPSFVIGAAQCDSFLNARLQRFGLTVDCQSATGGWLTQLSLKDVKLVDKTKRVRCSIREVRTTLTAFELLGAGTDLGQLTLVDPVVEIDLDENGDLPSNLFPTDDNPNAAAPELQINVINGRFVLSVPGRKLPIVELAALDISAKVANRDSGRWLDIEPVSIFDHQAIAESHTEQNLAMVAPVLSQSASLDGDVSVTLHKTSLQLDAETGPALDLSGEAVFHSVSARLKEDWVVQISQMLGKAVGRKIPDHLKIMRESSVQFTVNEKGISHDGLAFLLPDISKDIKIHSSGLVGLDEQIDLALRAQLPQAKGGGLFATVLSQMTGLIQISVRGTVDDPKLITPPGMSLLKQFSGNLNPQEKPDRKPTISGSVFDLVGASRSGDPAKKVAGVAGGVLNLIRAAGRDGAESEDAGP